jgi:hypothetical protein
MRFVVECFKENGLQCPRWHFNANMKMIKTIMIEWTKTEDGEKHGTHTTEKHMHNHFTVYVGMQITNDTPGIKILRDVQFLFEGTNATNLHRAYVALFTIPHDKCPNPHAA